ncbi:MAG: hypothetical protein WA817_11695 [Candidatus Acidiferrum sp.]
MTRQKNDQIWENTPQEKHGHLPSGGRQVIGMSGACKEKGQPLSQDGWPLSFVTVADAASDLKEAG